MTTDLIYHTLKPQIPPAYTAEEQAAAQIMYDTLRRYEMDSCLWMAHKMLNAAKDVEDNEFLTGFAKQEGVEDDTSIAPGSPTDFVLY